MLHKEEGVLGPDMRGTEKMEGIRNQDMHA